MRDDPPDGQAPELGAFRLGDRADQALAPGSGAFPYRPHIANHEHPQVGGDDRDLARRATPVAVEYPQAVRLQVLLGLSLPLGPGSRGAGR